MHTAVVEKEVSLSKERRANNGDIADEEALRGSSANPLLFEILIKRYRQRLLHKIYGYVHDHHAAEDIVQETFLSVWNHRDDFVSRGAGFRSWIFTIGINFACTYHRRHNKQSIVESFDDAVIVSPDDAAEYEEDDRYAYEDDTHDQRLTVAKLLMLLPPEPRALLAQHYLEDKPYNVIAAEEGITIGALKMKLMRARKLCRTMMEKNTKTKPLI